MMKYTPLVRSDSAPMTSAYSGGREHAAAGDPATAATRARFRGASFTGT
jgi:hypothetical protein